MHYCTKISFWRPDGIDVEGLFPFFSPKMIVNYYYVPTMYLYVDRYKCIYSFQWIYFVSWKINACLVSGISRHLWLKIYNAGNNGFERLPTTKKSRVVGYLSTNKQLPYFSFWLFDGWVLKKVLMKNRKIIKLRFEDRHNCRIM